MKRYVAEGARVVLVGEALVKGYRCAARGGRRDDGSRGVTPHRSTTPTSTDGSVAPAASAAGSCRRRLIAALDELDIAWQKAMVDPTFLQEFEGSAAELRRRPEHALRRAPALRARRRPDPAQARGPQPHRRPQDPQRARPGAADQADGQDPGDRRDRGRPARRRLGHRRGLPRARLHRLHGRGRHRAPGAQRRPDAAARRRGRSRSRAGRARSRTRSTRRCATGSRASTTPPTSSARPPAPTRSPAWS